MARDLEFPDAEKSTRLSLGWWICSYECLLVERSWFGVGRMASRWRKAKLALGMCVYVPRDRDDGETALGVAAGRFSDASSVSPVTTPGSEYRPATPTTSFDSLPLSKSGRRSSKVQSLSSLLFYFNYLFGCFDCLVLRSLPHNFW